MRKQMIENAAFEVATQVNAVEESIDAALAEIAELQARMIRARSVARVGVNTGHEALAQLADAVQALVGARGAMAACHTALIDAKGQVPGLRTLVWASDNEFGDGDECPKYARADLRVVA
ncbi:MAG TPA: hypothetical protein VNH53_03580 [Sphingomicrobium sp.]|jgi:hypothetical protein|nr:hypothetical protein [Sphingomicrobium sp.]